MDRIVGLALCLLVSGCQVPTQADLIGTVREKAAADAACHRRSMQRIQEFRACLRLPYQSAEQQACYAASRDTSTFVNQLDCRQYHERTTAFRRALRNAADICLAIYPSTTPEQMEDFSACVDERLGW